MIKRYLSLFLILAISLVPLSAAAIKYKGDLESNESVTFPEQGSKPTSPAATKHKLYFKDDGAAYSLDSSGNENPLAVAGLKNKLINSNFDLWQRGTPFNGIAAGAYHTDRWLEFDNGTTEMINITRQAFTLGQTDVPGEPQYYLDLEVATKGDMTTTRLIQRIEGVRTFAGQTIAISYWAKATSGFSARADIVQHFGTGGSPSANVGTSGSSVTLTTAWQKFTQVLSIPGISGKILGTNNNDSINLTFIWDSVPTAVTVSIAQVQLEKGSVVTGFERRPPGLELALAQRYYQKTFPLATAPAQNAGVADALCYNALLAGANKFNMNWILKTPMRTDPTITYYNPSAANNKFRNTPDAGDSGTPATDVLSPNYVFIRNPQVATDGVGEQVCIHATAAAEL